MKTYDLIVIGAGPGGYVAAIRAAQLGLGTAIVEKDSQLGGTCVTIGCIPSKALLTSSELYHAAKSAQLRKHGIKTGAVELDLNAMMRRKDGIVRQLTSGVAHLMKKNTIDVHSGRARLAARDRVIVAGSGGEIEIGARAILLATGSVPVELPFARFDGRFIVSSTEALAFDEVPAHLVVVGAGAIGLELGSVWRRLGSEVTVIEMLPRIAPTSDIEAAETLRKCLEAQGFRFRLSAKLLSVDPERKTIRFDADGKEEELVCDRVLVAVGRRAYTEGLGLAEVGVETARGKIPVDTRYQTNVEGIYAIGDVIDGPMLAHKAEDEGIACAELLAGRSGHVNYAAIPSVIYTAPELASVGQTEEQLKEQGVAYKRGSFPFMVNGRAKALGERDGMVKVLAAQSDDRVLGVHIVGPHASELIAEATIVIEFGGSSEDIARTCHAHPTLTEVVREAALAVDGRSLHM